MIHWIPYAFVRIVFFFICGIFIGIYFPDILSEKYVTLFFLIAVSVYTLIAVLAWQKKFLNHASRIKVYAGVVGLTCLFSAGYLNVLTNTDTRRPDHLANIESPIEFYKAVITSSPKEKSRSWKVEAFVESVRTSNQWLDCRANILLYFSKEDFPTPYQYGDVLLVKGIPQQVPGPGNPEEFDYRRFLSFKNIYHQHFILNDNVKLIGREPQSWIDYYALRCRAWAETELKNHVTGIREQGIVSALVLGVTDGLDNELLTAYKASGAMHILSVSGLHVGIIYGLILFLLKPLQKVKHGKWVLAGISIVALWLYAFITGLSPSVLRAVTMFSFVALAKPAQHRTNIYNILAASAFCILVYDPYLIMSVGFQLSYLAVLGIVYLQSGLYKLWEPANRLLDEIWKISSVSIAAQLATFALGLLYFHQFPNYFLLSNLFVIPGSFIVLIVGLVLLALSFIQPIAFALGFIIEWIIKALNFIVFAVEEFPFSLIENVYITTFQCWLLLGALIAVILLLHTRKFAYLLVTSSIVFIYSMAHWNHFQYDVNVQKLTVYNVKGHTAIDLIDRGQTFFVADSLLLKDSDKIGFHITPHRIMLGVNETIHSGDGLLKDLRGCSLMVWKGKSILRIYDKDFYFPNNMSVNYVIISNNAVKDLTKISAQLKMEQLIFDSSNALYLTNKLLKQTNSVQCGVYSVLQQGAFESYI
jgi:competence protein ComEC